MTGTANSSAPGSVLVFFVAENGNATVVNVTTDKNGAHLTTRIGDPLPSGVQGGHILTLAAGLSSVDGQVQPQVGVLTSNGTVYYNLLFSFFINGSWSNPQRESRTK